MKNVEMEKVLRCQEVSGQVTSELVEVVKRNIREA